MSAATHVLNESQHSIDCLADCFELVVNNIRNEQHKVHARVLIPETEASFSESSARSRAILVEKQRVWFYVNNSDKLISAVRFNTFIQKNPLIHLTTLEKCL
jgi:hypothetical protein